MTRPPAERSLAERIAEVCPNRCQTNANGMRVCPDYPSGCAGSLRWIPCDWPGHALEAEVTQLGREKDQALEVADTWKKRTESAESRVAALERILLEAPTVYPPGHSAIASLARVRAALGETRSCPIVGCDLPEGHEPTGGVDASK